MAQSPHTCPDVLYWYDVSTYRPKLLLAVQCHRRSSLYNSLPGLQIGNFLDLRTLGKMGPDENSGGCPYYTATYNNYMFLFSVSQRYWWSLDPINPTEVLAHLRAPQSSRLSSWPTQCSHNVCALTHPSAHRRVPDCEATAEFSN